MMVFLKIINNIMFYYARLPKYMNRLAGKKVKEDKRIGIFFVVVGWDALYTGS